MPITLNIMGMGLPVFVLEKEYEIFERMQIDILTNILGHMIPGVPYFLDSSREPSIHH